MAQYRIEDGKRVLVSRTLPAARQQSHADRQTRPSGKKSGSTSQADQNKSASKSAATGTKED